MLKEAQNIYAELEGVLRSETQSLSEPELNFYTNLLCELPVPVAELLREAKRGVILRHSPSSNFGIQELVTSEKDRLILTLKGYERRHWVWYEDEQRYVVRTYLKKPNGVFITMPEVMQFNAGRLGHEEFDGAFGSWGIRISKDPRGYISPPLLNITNSIEEVNDLAEREDER